MIKVNLLRNVGFGQASPAGGMGGGGGNATQGMALLKLAAMLVCPLLLYFYEKSHIESLQAGINEKQAKVAEVEAARSKYGDTGPRVEKYNKEKSVVDKQLVAIRGLARNRLREVKTLDAIQSLLPAQAWLKKLAINGEQVTMEGYTVARGGVSDMLKTIENSVYFSEVQPRSTNQEEINGQTAEHFQIEFKIGKPQTEAAK